MRAMTTRTLLQPAVPAHIAAKRLRKAGKWGEALRLLNALPQHVALCPFTAREYQQCLYSEALECKAGIDRDYVRKGRQDPIIFLAYVQSKSTIRDFERGLGGGPPL